MADVRSAMRANLPSEYAFSLVSPPPPNTPTASRPCLRCVERIASAMRSSASSHDTGRNGSSRESRASGVVSRAGEVSSSADVQPFWHMPPRLVGKSRSAIVC
jgi:hypothetical protein